MKLQVVELPGRRVGDATETPFLLVLSEVRIEDVQGVTEPMKEKTGACGVLVFEDPVEVLPRVAAQ